MDRWRFVCFSPNSACTMGCWRIKRLVTQGQACCVVARAKHVAKTLEISTFTNKMMLWLQWEASSHHVAAATATFFPELLMQYCFFLVETMFYLLKPTKFRLSGCCSKILPHPQSSYHPSGGLEVNLYSFSVWGLALKSFHLEFVHFFSSGVH